MTLQQIASKIKNRDKKTAKKKDVVYTPNHIAKILIENYLNDIVEEGDTILDPCKGNGAFYDNYPKKCKKLYCEISEGKDFYEFNEPIDHICSNPPYSHFTKFVEHSKKIAKKSISFLINNFNLTPVRVKFMEEDGWYITKIHLFDLKKWFGRQNYIVWEKRKEKPLTQFTWGKYKN